MINELFGYDDIMIEDEDIVGEDPEEFNETVDIRALSEEE